MEGSLWEEFNLPFHNSQNKKQANCCTTTLLEAVWGHEANHAHIFLKCTKMQLLKIFSGLKYQISAL